MSIRNHFLVVLLTLAVAPSYIAFVQAADAPAPDRRDDTDLEQSTAETAEDSAAETAVKPRLPFLISKETTRITEPLRDDGYVDYVKAINLYASRGVTPENNALVPLLNVIGPKQISDSTQDEFFRLLGIDPVPVDGDYLAPLYEFLKNLDLTEDERGRVIDEQRERSWSEPWSAEKFPAIAKWIDRYEAQLDQAVAATRRPKYYAPMLCEDGSDAMLMAMLLPTVSEVRRLAQMLRTRAMLRVGQGKTDAAWDDLLACHRLARLVAQGPTLIDFLVGASIETGACQSDAALVHHGKVTAKVALRYNKQLQQLAPLPAVVDKMDVAERFMYLDSVAWVARKGPDGLTALNDFTDVSSSLAGSFKRALFQTMINWNVPLKRGNVWYDRLVKAVRMPRGSERERALGQIERELIQVASTANDPASIVRGLMFGRTLRTEVSERISSMFMALLMPALTHIVNAEDRVAAMREMVEIVFALAAYRSSEGKYPDRLEKLVPARLANLPQDPFGEGTYGYKPMDDGFVVYSVGLNGIDEGGVNEWDDLDGDLEGDDISIRMPAN